MRIVSNLGSLALWALLVALSACTGPDTPVLTHPKTLAITAVSPAQVVAGDALTITGTGFGPSQAASTVLLGETAVTPTSWSATAIVLSVPGNIGAGAQPVQVTVAAVQSNAMPVQVVPSIRTVSPTEWVAGASVVIEGDNFGSTAGTVAAGGVSLSVVEWSQNSISIQVPPELQAGVHTVSVQAGGEDSGTVAVTVRPLISAISAASATKGSLITLTGANFGATQGVSTILVGATAVTPTQWSHVSVAFTVGDNIAPGNQQVTVVVGSQSSNGISLTIRPSLQVLSAGAGPQGSSVTVQGANFGAAQGASSLMMGGVSVTPQSWNASSITFLVPNGLPVGEHTISVSAGGQISNGLVFTVTESGQPFISQLSPASALAGATVVIAGGNFGASPAGISEVRIDGVTQSHTAWSNTQIEFVLPGGFTPGAHSVVVIANSLTSNAATLTVVIPGAPQITAVDPVGATGGTTVSITGVNFGATLGTSTLTLGGTVIATSSWSASTIGFTVPGTIQAGELAIVVTVNSQASNAVLLPVRPNITGVSPSGAQLAGASMTVAGSNFGASPGASTVSVGGRIVTTTAWSMSSFSFDLPSDVNPGAQNVVVTVGGQVSNVGTMTVKPAVTSLSLATGSGGDTLTLNGTNLGSSQGTVGVGGATATITSWSNSAVEVLVPATPAPGAGNVVLTAGGQSAAAMPLTIIPKITQISPAGGVAGASVTLTGVNFGLTGTLTFGGVGIATTGWSATQIVFTVPGAATAGGKSVTVTAGGQTSNAFAYTVTLLSQPTISSLSPVSGSGGDSITISGSNFGTVWGGVIVGSQAAPLVSWLANSIVITVPLALTPGLHAIMVTAGTDTSNAVDFAVRPKVATVSPNLATGGANITVTGIHLGASGTLTVGGTAVTPASWTSTVITFVVPADLQAGNRSIVVASGGQTSYAAAFTIGTSISAVSPQPATAGTTITVTGSNFGPSQGTSTFSVGGAAVVPATWSHTAITFIVPVSLPGGSQAISLTVGGQTASDTLLVQPAINGLTPATGSAGTNVTATGSGFGPSAAQSRISVGGYTATASSWSAGSLLFAIPSDVTAGTRAVAITVGGQISNGRTFTVVPLLSSISPDNATGGQTVTLTGKHFGTAGSLTVGGAAVSPSAWSPTSIQFVVPATAPAGVKPVVVTVNAQASNSLSLTVKPAIVSVTPASGSAGASVTIAGSNFGALGTLLLGGATVSTSGWSNSAVVFTVPGSMAGGTHSLTVQTGGQSASTTFAVLPVLSTRTPAYPTAGSTVTLTGLNFGASQGSSVVRLGTQAQTATAWSTTSVSFALPATFGAGVSAVSLTVGGLSTASLSISVLPRINSLNPATGVLGASVTLTGSNFGASAGTVTVGGLTAAITAWSNTSIGLTIPAGLSLGVKPVVVTQAGLTSNIQSFNVTNTPAPAISSISPASASGGALVSVTGTNFGAPGTATVGGTAVITSVWTVTNVQFTLPANIPAGTRNIVIQSGTDGQSSGAFAFAVVPAMTGLSASQGSAGDSITITGSNFGASQGSSTLTLGGATVTMLTSWSHTSISFDVPSAPAAGIRSLALGVNGQSAAVNFTVYPRIDTLSPNSGSTGSSVVLSGVHFGAAQGLSTVSVGGIDASITSWSATSVEISVPLSLADGPHNVAVTVNSVTSTAANFTVGTVSGPVISSVSPLSVSSADVLTISGTGFGDGNQPGDGVLVGGYSAWVVGWSDTSILIQVSLYADGGAQDVIVFAQSLESNAVSVTIRPYIDSLYYDTNWQELNIYGTNLRSAGTSAADALEVDAGNGWYALGSAFFVDSDYINAGLPAAVTAGTYSLRVLSGGVYSNTVSFTVSPSLNDLAPYAGPPGTQLRIAGFGFGASKGASTVSIGGSLAPVVSWNPQEIVVVVPSLSADMYHAVSVTVNGIAATSCCGFFNFYVTSWGIRSISPAAVYGGQQITVAGTGFTSTEGTLYFGWNPVTIISWSDTQIVAVAPSNWEPGLLPVQVELAGSMDASNTFDVEILSQITSLSASSGTGGDVVVIYGTNFGNWGDGISFGGVPATTTAWSPIAITAYVPRGVPAGVVDVSVNHWGVSSNSVPFSVHPTLLSLSPISGPYGSVAGVRGTNFGAPATSNTITLGGVPVTIAFAEVERIVFSIPQGSPTGSQNVVLTAAGQTSNALSFTVLSWGISSVLPSTAKAGTTVTVSGNGFGTKQVGDGVYIGATEVASTQWTDTAVTFVVPTSLTAGTTTVWIQKGANASNLLSFIIVPSLTSLTPASGGVGTSVTLTGANFGGSQSGNQVLFGDVAATVSSWSNNSIVATIPLTAGPGAVATTVMVGGVSSNARSFVHQRPWIDSRYPAIGTVGTSISLLGRYFGGSQGTAAFGGVQGQIQGWSDTNVQVGVQAGTPKGRQFMWLVMPSTVTSNAVSYTQRGSDLWIPFEPLGISRSFNATVWTGTEMLVWGGSIGEGMNTSRSGARYNAVADAWLPMSEAGAPSARILMSAAWSGLEMIVWGGTNFNTNFADGGRYDPRTDTWRSMQSAGAPSARALAATVWLGNRMFIWGGSGVFSGGVLDDGAIYDPLTDTWTTVEQAVFTPTARYDVSAVWTGAEVLIWGGSDGMGGYFADGGRYNPSTGEWRPLSAENAPSARASHSTVWTGAEMVVWGGGPMDVFGGMFGDPVSTGGRYDPALDQWRATALNALTPEPLFFHAAEWTGSEMIVWGSFGLAAGARYDPVADAWNSMNQVDGPQTGMFSSSVWTGEEFIVWGGYNNTSAGGKYNPGTDSWNLMEGSYMPSANQDDTVVWTGSEILVFSSAGSVRFNPATDTWLPIAGVPGRSDASAVWAGTVALVWGGFECGDMFCGDVNTGYRLVPGTGSWTPMSTVDAPSERSNAFAAWTGSEAIFWGGDDPNWGMPISDGARYNPLNDTWTVIAADAYTPPARMGASVVWTGDQLIVWGGYDVMIGAAVNEGARYRPSLDVWSPVAVTNAPAPRSWHSATWAGGRMIIYGDSDAGGAAAYNPVGDSWSAVSSTNEPEARSSSIAVAMGARVFIWGGNSWNGGTALNSGAIYDVVNDEWAPITDAGAPSPAVPQYFKGLWTGEFIALWGIDQNGGPLMTRYLP